MTMNDQPYLYYLAISVIQSFTFFVDLALNDITSYCYLCFFKLSTSYFSYTFYKQCLFFLGIIVDIKYILSSFSNKSLHSLLTSSFYDK